MANVNIGPIRDMRVSYDHAPDLRSTRVNLDGLVPIHFNVTLTDETMTTLRIQGNEVFDVILRDVDLTLGYQSREFVTRLSAAIHEVVAATALRAGVSATVEAAAREVEFVRHHANTSVDVLDEDVPEELLRPPPMGVGNRNRPVASPVTVKRRRKVSLD